MIWNMVLILSLNRGSLPIDDLRNQMILCAKENEAKHDLHKKLRNSSTISYSPNSINELIIFNGSYFYYIGLLTIIEECKTLSRFLFAFCLID